MSGDTIEHPTEYAERKLDMLRARWEGPMGDALRAHGPRLWPGVPLTALVGLSASSSGYHESGPKPDFTRGVYGVEREWLHELAARATAFLGRPVSDLDDEGTYTDDEGTERPYYLDDPEAQVVTGLMNYRRHLEAVIEHTDMALWQGPKVLTSSWALRVAAGAYSSGPAVPRAMLNARHAHLAAAKFASRWPLAASWVVDFVDQDKHEISGVEIRGKWHMAIMHLRIEQRLMCGRLLEEAVNGPDSPDLAWFAVWVNDHGPLVARLRELADWRKPT